MHSIYALSDPRTKKIRYIGMTQDIHKRYAQHLLTPHGGEEKIAWFEELKQAGVVPTLTILEANIETSCAREREQHWITYHIARGANLTNVNGVIYPTQTEEKPFTLPEEIQNLAGISPEQAKQITPKVGMALEKIYMDEPLTKKEGGLLLRAVFGKIEPGLVPLIQRFSWTIGWLNLCVHRCSPLETGIALSIASKHAISHRYVKELTRGAKPRLKPARTAGKTFLYKLGDVHRLGAIRQRPGAGNRKPRVKQEQ